jgi:hypothetical protein
MTLICINRRNMILPNKWKTSENKINFGTAYHIYNYCFQSRINPCWEGLTSVKRNVNVNIDQKNLETVIFIHPVIVYYCALIWCTLIIKCAPLPQYAFMVWCLVKAQGQRYLFMEYHFIHAVIGCFISWCNHRNKKLFFSYMLGQDSTTYEFWVRS